MCLLLFFELLYYLFLSNITNSSNYMASSIYFYIICHVFAQLYWFKYSYPIQIVSEKIYLTHWWDPYRFCAYDITETKFISSTISSFVFGFGFFFFLWLFLFPFCFHYFPYFCLHLFISYIFPYSFSHFSFFLSLFIYFLFDYFFFLFFHFFIYFCLHLFIYLFRISSLIRSITFLSFFLSFFLSLTISFFLFVCLFLFLSF